MAEVQQKDGGKGGKKVKQKKQTLRVDFTPMVDMNMLLITFFMFCTSLSKPQTMEIAMPPKDKDLTDVKEPPKLADDLAITLILDADNKAFYYLGMPNYSDPNSLKTTDYSPDGIRKLLMGKNVEIVRQINDIKKKLLDREITQEQFKTQSAEIKRKVKDSPMVMIKPTDGSSYRNLIDALDEMQICNIARYAILDTTEVDRFVMQNWASGGALSKAASAEGTLK